MKKQNTPLKVAFWGNVVLAVLVLLWATPWQAVPFILFSGFAGIMIYKNRNLKVALIVIAGIMAILNLAFSSGIDVLVWVISLMLVIV